MARDDLRPVKTKGEKRIDGTAYELNANGTTDVGSCKFGDGHSSRQITIEGFKIVHVSLSSHLKGATVMTPLRKRMIREL